MNNNVQYVPIVFRKGFWLSCGNYTSDINQAIEYAQNYAKKENAITGVRYKRGNVVVDKRVDEQGFLHTHTPSDMPIKAPYSPATGI